MRDATGYHDLVVQLPDVGLIVTDRDMRVVLAAGEALLHVGWRADELVGHQLGEFLRPPVASVIEEHMAAALRGERTVVPALPGTRGDIVWEAQFRPLHRQDGGVTGVIFLLQDVTRLGAGERALVPGDRLWSTLDVLPDAFAVLSPVRDRRGQIVDLRAEYANPAACALFQLPPQGLTGQRLLSLRPSLGPLGIFGKLVHTMKTGKPAVHQVTGIKDEALTRAFEIRGAKLRDEVVVTAHDITARVEAERHLRASEERYRVTVESAASGVANVSLDGRFLRVNRRFCEITGYPENELLARTYRDITHPDDMQLHLALAQQVISGEIPWYAVEKRYIRKDGPVVWVGVTVGALRDHQGRVHEYIDTVTDITTRKYAQEQVAQLNAELEARVRQRTAELEEANRNLEAFTYTVSHDLRAPLTALSGTVEVLSEEYASQLSGAGLDHLARIQTVTGRMDRLIGDLLALSQASSAEIRLARVDLSRLAHDVITALREHDPGRQVETLIEGGVHVQGDERLLCTVMDNILGNAWKFTSKTPRARIEFATLPAAQSTVHCCVRDNGAGFEPASAAQLFRPFSRLHPDQDFPGTGIGLASVQRILERHHGRCWAEGQPGHGATFHFTLPADSGP
jgi:PAS domain S-box-containing protein